MGSQQKVAMALRFGVCWSLPWYSRGHSREPAAEQSGRDRQTLWDWAHRYNDAGVRGLSPSAAVDKVLLTTAEMADLKELTIEGEFGLATLMNQEAP